MSRVPRLHRSSEVGGFVLSVLCVDEPRVESCTDGHHNLNCSTVEDKLGSDALPYVYSNKSLGILLAYSDNMVTETKSTSVFATRRYAKTPALPP